MSNQFNSFDINTKPGACTSNPFSPPADFSGDEEDYLQMLRDRFQNRCHCQRMHVIARQYHHPEALVPTLIKGPYQFEAWKVISSLRYQT